MSKHVTRDISSHVKPNKPNQDHHHHKRWLCVSFKYRFKSVSRSKHLTWHFNWYPFLLTPPSFYYMTAINQVRRSLTCLSQRHMMPANCSSPSYFSCSITGQRKMLRGKLSAHLTEKRGHAYLWSRQHCQFWCLGSWRFMTVSLLEFKHTISKQ